jgi:hypothetical protein
MTIKNEKLLIADEPSMKVEADRSSYFDSI